MICQDICACILSIDQTRPRKKEKAKVNKCLKKVRTNGGKKYTQAQFKVLLATVLRSIHKEINNI